MRVKASGISDVGLKRELNEDSYSVEDSLGLYIVADGMGGHLAGEVASQIAVEMITKSFRKWSEKETPEEEIFGIRDPSLSRHGNYILSGIRLANSVIHEMAVEYEQYHGMGTTVAIILVLPDLIIAANVGDSRVYMVRDGQIERLSKDHTIVAEQVEMGVMTEEEAETSPLKHILTRNLGSAEEVEPDIYEFEPSNNDRFILCSDGLTDLVRDREIFDIVQEEEEPEALCRRFVEKALKRGGHDNTTVVSVFLSGIEKRREGPMRRVALLFADLLIGLQKIVKKFRP
ncbi:MAG: Stp1/IreP family PP2C-type Ser/Thr phosphatase [Deltaproteobacteria bacterium]|nr:Stp1/IreP family PP2C-type Ser/Thr phosphatase [Deltaproteobacteria bacterium]